MKTFKVIISGSRTFNDYAIVRDACDNILQDKADSHNILIVSGTAKGTDRLGEQYAFERGYEILRFPADWQKYGRSAGIIRNKEMAFAADALIAFWDGKSAGTASMIRFAKEKNMSIRIIHV